MQTPASSSSTPSTSSTLPSSFHTHPLPNSSQLQRIGEIFSISWPADAPFAQQHQKSFQAVVTACEKGEWQKLDQATSLFKNLRDPAGATPFQACVEQGLTETVQELLTRNLAKPLSSGEYTHALHTAARYGWKELVELLCKYVDINSKDQTGKTALLHAIEEGQGEIVGWLIDQNAALLPFRQKLSQETEIDLSPLAFAVMCGEIECVDVLIAKRMPPSQTVHGLGNLLHVAVRFGQHITLEHLLQSYPQQTRALIEGHDPKGRTPLSVAAYLGDLEAIAILTALQADADSPDTEQRTPMHWAALGRRKEAIELLHQAHASLNSVDANTHRPIDLIQGDDEPSRICRSLLTSLQKGKQKQALAKLSGIPPENLVLQGDGPREVYVGALQALRESNALQGIKRIAGTKEHTVLAALLAVGYRSQELSEKLAQAPQLMSLTQWLDEQITLRTKISHCTLGELSTLVDQGKPCKHLHLLITLPRSCGFLHIHSENTQWQDVVIADACALALAPPKLDQLQVRCKGEDGTCVVRKLQLDSLYTNQPVALFDQQRYLSPWLAKEEKGTFPVYNKRTLAISVYEPQQASHASPLSTYNEYRTLEIAALAPLSTTSLADIGLKATRRFFEDRALSMEHYQRKGAVLFGLKNSNRHFVGRKAHLEWFEKKVTSASWDPSREALVCALYGPGGIGKSDLACTFANRYLDSFSLIAWINCETKETRAIAYRDLAEGPLRIPLEGKESPETVQKMVYRRLEGWSSSKPWLLVFDNVEEKLGLPQRGGCIVATSRDKGLWDLDERKQVQRFSPQEAIHLLEKTIGRKDLQLAALAKQLDNYPLALDIAGCYIAGQEASFTIQEYLEELKEHEGAHSLLKGKGQRRYPRSLESAWQLTLSQLQKRNPQALAWLNLCAYFASEDIPQSWLQDWLHAKTQKPSPNLKREARDLLNALCSYGLVKRGAKRFSIHRLMQEAIQVHQKEPPVRYAAALSFLKQQDAFDEDDPKTWDAGKAWLPHALWAMQHHLVKEAEGELGAILHYRIGRVQNLLADFPKVLNHRQRAFAMFRKIYGEDATHPLIAISLGNIGNVYSDLGRYKQALRHHNQALAMRKKIYGDDTAHPSIAVSLNNIGAALRALGRHEEALRHFEHALAMRKKIYGDDTAHPSIAHSLGSIGITLRALGRNKQALRHHNQTLASYKKIYGEDADHPDLAASLNSIGAALGALGRHEEAFRHFNQAFAIFGKIYGEDTAHPNIAGSLSNIGAALDALGHYEEALRHYNRALAMQKKVYGEDVHHPDIANSLNNIGIALRALGRSEEALRHHNQAFAMRKKIYGEDVAHPHLANSLGNIGTALSNLGRNEEALRHFEQALAMKKKIYGQDAAHLSIADSLNNIGTTLNALGRNKQALRHFEQALASYKKIYGQDADHPDIASSLNNIGAALNDLGHKEEALCHYNQALRMYRILILPDTHPALARTLRNIQRLQQRSKGCTVS